MSMSAERIARIREKLREARTKGELGVIAARTKIAESDLYSWCSNPVFIPNLEELVALEGAMERS